MSSDIPDMLIPTAAPAEYPSVEDLLGSAGGMVEATVEIPLWTRADGTPMKVRVRGLDFPTQTRVRLQAQRATPANDRALGVIRHEPTFAAATLAAGLTAPVITFDQAMKLIAGRHARAVVLLVDFIWTLSTTKQETINEIVAAEAEAELAADQSVAADEADDGKPATAEE